MRFLNRTDIRLLVRPFLPEYLLTTRLEGIFAVVQNYVDTSVSDKPQQLQHLRQTLTAFSDEAITFGTYYSKTLLADLAVSLSALVEDDFLQACGRPAEISLAGVKKKYPLHKPGPLDIRLRLRNEGQGQASTVTVVGLDSTCLEFQSDIVVGDVRSSQELEVDLPAILPSSEQGALATIRVDWDSLSPDVYSIEPVMTRAHLIGRRAIFDRLLSASRAERLGSSILTGQKRVGKTSVAKTLQTELGIGANARDPNVVYIEGGEYIHCEPLTTIARLRDRLCAKIAAVRPGLPQPQPNDSADTLASVGDYLDTIVQYFPAFRLLVILDEFDELPLEVYRRGNVGDALFLALRYLSNRPELGFLLIGGEKMEFINTYQGDQLNKFQRLELDYFRRETEWSDFIDLVQRPAAGTLEFGDEALATIYDWTAGHPYFANLLCRQIWDNARVAHDNFVSAREVQVAAHQTVSLGVSSNSFQHFWDDGILEDPIRAEQVSLRRRRALVCLGESLRGTDYAPLATLEARAQGFGIAVETIRSDLNEFRRRKVTEEDERGITPKVRLFGDWLRTRGVSDIITTFATEDEALREVAQRERLQVSSADILAWLDGVCHYKGKHLTADDVRAWLDQFGDIDSQRVAFTLLQNAMIVSNTLVRAKYAEVMQTVRRGMRVQVDDSVRKRRDILVSYLQGPGKSGPSYAKIFADENGVFFDNVVDHAALLRRSRDAIVPNALIIVDDFIGTGSSACAGLSELSIPITTAIDSGVTVVFAAVAGFAKGIANVEKYLAHEGLDVRVIVPERLDDTNRVFSAHSEVFRGAAARNTALGLLSKIGKEIEPKSPLGYADDQALVVFENNCPNNTLPVFWSSGTSKRPWRPLFPRQ